MASPLTVLYMPDQAISYRGGTLLYRREFAVREKKGRELPDDRRCEYYRDLKPGTSGSGKQMLD